MTSAAPSVVPWETSLPRLSSEEAELRRRGAPQAATLRDRGPRMAEALSEALVGIWPFGANPTRTLVRLALGGPGEPREVELDRFPATIGRAESCALRLDEDGVSSAHARIEAEAGLAALVDARSTNGTRLNGSALAPLVRALLRPGDRVEIGPRSLQVVAIEASPRGKAELQVRATPPRLRRADPLAGSAASDRWVEVRWAGLRGFVRLSAPWLRAFWTPLHEAASLAEPGPLEEGAAQFAFARLAQAVSERVGEPVEVGGWLSPDQVAEAAGHPEAWLESDAWISGGGISAATRLVVPVTATASRAERSRLPRDMLFAARVCLGWVRLTRGEWATLEPGDALLPDFWWPAGWVGGGAPEMGGAYLRVGNFWCGGSLMRSEAGARLRLDQPWFRAVGGEWLVADDNPVPGAGALPVDDLELQIAVELDRFAVALRDLEGWRTGEVLQLRQGPGDPVRLVMETGLQRRVVAEGRVVVVEGRLGIELLRVFAPTTGAPRG